MDKSLRIQVLLAAIDKVTAPFKNIGKAGKDTNKELQATQKRLKELNRASAELKAFRGLKGDLNATERELGQAERKVAALAQQMKGVDGPTRKLSADFKRAQQDAAKLRQTYEQQGQELSRLRQRVNDAGAAEKGLVAHERDLRTAIGRTNDELQEQQKRLEQTAKRQERLAKAKATADRVSGKMRSGGTIAAAAGVAIAVPLIAGEKQTLEFEENIASMRQVLNVADSDLGRLRSEIMDLYAAVPSSTKEGLTAIYASAGQAGVATKDLKAFAEQAELMHSAIDDLSEEDAGAMLGKWQTGLKLNIKEAADLTDQINAVSDATSGAKSGVIADIVTKVGSFAHVAGVSTAAAAGLAAAYAATGQDAEQAAPAIQKMLVALTKGPAASKKQQAALAQLHMTSNGMAKAMQKNGPEAIMSVFRALAKLPKTRQLPALGDLFGAKAAASMAPFLDNLDLLQAKLKLVQDPKQYAGSSKADQQTANDTPLQNLKSARREIEALTNDALSPFNDTIKSVAQKVSGMAAGFRNWSKQHPAIAKGVVALVAGLSVFLVLLGGMAIAVSTLVAPMLLLGAAGAETGIGLGAAAAGAWAFLAPILLVVAIIAAVAAAAFLIITNWGPISGFFKKLWSGIVDVVMSGVHAITGFVQGLWTEVKQAFAGGLVGVLGLLLRWSPAGLFIRALLAIFPGLKGLGPRFAGVAADLVRNLVDGLGRGVAWIRSVFTPMGEFFAGVWARIRGIFSGSIGEILLRLASFSPMGLLLRAFAPAMTWLAQLGDRFAQLGVNLIQGLIRGITGKLGDLKGTIVNAASSAANWFKSKLGIHSPSRVFASFGDFTMQGLQQGLQRSQAGPLAAVKAIAGKMAAAAAIAASTPVLAGPAGPGQSPAVAPLAAARSDVLKVAFDRGRTVTEAVRAGDRARREDPVRQAPAAPAAPLALPPMTFHIHQAAGQDPQDLAREVARQVQLALEKAQRQAGARRGSNFEDED